MPMTIRVGRGSAMFTDENMFSKTGITNTSRTTIAITATLMMTPG